MHFTQFWGYGMGRLVSTSLLLILSVLVFNSLAPVIHSTEEIRFAIVGDFGVETKEALGVANLIKGWNPDFITTVGDNNYPDGAMGPMDDNIGQYYHQYIHNYIGTYGEGSLVQRFFPALGNHDWESIYCTGTSCRGPYFDYFGIDAETERYYTFQQGPVRFFMLDSDSAEPDGISGLSNQAIWLKEQLAASDAAWNLVHLHHPPYSSGGHRSHELLQWPFAQWGADAVFSGHNHLYERIERDGMIFFTNGLGGKSRHQYRKEQPEWVKHRFNVEFGAMLVEASSQAITFQFWDRFGTLHDSYTMVADNSDDPNTDSPELHSASAEHKISVAVTHATQDAVEEIRTGVVQLVDYVLPLGDEGKEGATLLGLRFTDVEVPADAVIEDAYIQFSNHRDENTGTSLTVLGEKSCSAKSFSPLGHSLSSRRKTAESVQWNELEDWELVGESHRTANLASIVQEIVGYGGWQTGNAMAFYLHGSGSRHAISFELQPKMAAELHIIFDSPLPATESFGYAEGADTLVPSIYLPMIMDSRCVLD